MKELKQQLIQQRYFTTNEMARELGISLPSLKKWTVKKIIPNPKKLGGFVYYDKQQILDFLNHKKGNK
jgi:predicted DNA-binding transcriptional regulator AlpA